MKQKKSIFALALLVCCVAILGMGTLAYFTAEETATNVITTGNIDIDLIETDADGQPFENKTGAMPGDCIDKVVTMKNTGANPAFVRVLACTTVVLADGSAGDTAPITIDFDTAHWTKSGDYYYYNAVLQPGETTKALFRTVTLSGAGMGNAYAGCTVCVTVTAEAVQSQNNGTTAQTAGGWA